MMMRLKNACLYLKDETVLDLCDDGAFSSEQGDLRKRKGRRGRNHNRLYIWTIENFIDII